MAKREWKRSPVQDSVGMERGVWVRSTREIWWGRGVDGSGASGESGAGSERDVVGGVATEGEVVGGVGQVGGSG
jgi:hypothetical protein